MRIGLKMRVAGKKYPGLYSVSLYRLEHGTLKLGDNYDFAVS